MTALSRPSFPIPMKHIKESISLSTTISKEIKTNDPEKLESLKDRLKDRLGIPVGWHMIGAPLLISMILAIFSFALSQPFIWLEVFSGLGLPKHTVMAAMVPVSLLYSAIVVATMFFTARGSLTAFKGYLAMLCFTALIAFIFFISTFIPAICGAERKLWFIVSSVIALVLIAGSIKCLNSAMFVRTIAYYLHNRVWRKQLSLQRQNMQG